MPPLPDIDEDNLYPTKVDVKAVADSKRRSSVGAVDLNRLRDRIAENRAEINALGSATSAPAQLAAIPSTRVRWTGEDGLTDTVGGLTLSGSARLTVGPGEGIKAHSPTAGHSVANALLQRDTSNEMTIEIVGLVGDTGGGAICSWGGAGETEPTNHLYQVEVETDGRFRFFAEYSATGTDYDLTLNGVIVPHWQWFHLAVTIDPGATSPTVDGEIKVYMNGELFHTESTYQASTGGSSGAFYFMTSASGLALTDSAVSALMMHDEVMDAATVLSRARAALGRA